MMTARWLAPLTVGALTAACAVIPARRLPPPPDPVAPPPILVDATADLFADESVLLDDLGPLFERLAEETAREADLIVLPGTPAALNPADFDITVHYNSDVQYWMDFFTGRGRDRFELFLTRQGRYEPMILQRLRDRGMPEDLIYLALIESGFSPRAYSRAHAVGIWQFIAATGRRYGLEISPFLDERRDPVRSTEAALDYLEDLYARFGSWYLAAAGYNTGENRVERILRDRMNGARGDDALFWDIQRYLPSETRNYIPMMLAAAILSRYRIHFGFDVVPEEPELWEVVTIPDATDLDVIADAAGVPRAEIDLLNPQFLRGMTPPGRQVQLRLPPGRAEPFAAAYALIPPEDRVRFFEHTVRRGETLSAIATAYGSSIAMIQAANNIRNPNRISIGQHLIIPRQGAPARTPVRVASAANGETTSSNAHGNGSAAAQTASSPPISTAYTVRSGDSLWAIASRFGVSVADLRAWNGLGQRSVIRPGQRLVIHPAPGGVLTHHVQPGDTLWDIARRHGVHPTDLMQWNNLSSNAVIRPGDQIRIHIGH